MICACAFLGPFLHPVNKQSQELVVTEWIITMHCLAQQQLNRLGLIWSQYWPCWCIFHLCPPNGVTEVAMS